MKIIAKKITLTQILDFLEENKTDEQYEEFTKNTFREFSSLFTKQPTFKQDMADCNMMLKQIMLPNNIVKGKEILCVV